MMYKGHKKKSPKALERIQQNLLLDNPVKTVEIITPEEPTAVLDMVSTNQ